jgi:hypothetical protein
LVAGSRAESGGGLGGGGVRPDQEKSLVGWTFCGLTMP